MNENIPTHYIMGVSLGGMSQPTALAILEQEARVRGEWGVEQTGLRLRHLERPPMDMAYPALIDHIEELLKALEDQETEDKGSALVIDITGTGRSVGKLMAESGLTPTMVTITGGSDETEPVWREWKVPKTALVGNLQVLYQAERIEVAGGLELLSTFTKELHAFKMRHVSVNDSDPDYWRENEFDDLIFAVALAAWQSIKSVPTPPALQNVSHEPVNNLGAGAWMA